MNDNGNIWTVVQLDKQLLSVVSNLSQGDINRTIVRMFMILWRRQI
jgi:hypothetical protein